MSEAWTLIGDVLAGATTIRGKGEAYLPKYEDESRAEYDRRRRTAPWRPEFADALQALSSKPFDKDVALDDGASDRIKGLSEDIDGRGNNLTAFAREAFSKGISKGLHAILVDYPELHGEGGKTLTVEQERMAGARPYWIQVQADDILALYTRWEGGREIVAHVRIRECAVERDGFGERKVERVRVYEPGEWQVWEKREKDGGFDLVADGPISRKGGQASVPLALFFTGERLGEMQVKPPLEELAHCQIELYQALSRQEEILTFAGSPMLKGKGMPADSEVVVGPKRILFTGDGAETERDFDYIQPAAANIAEIRNHVTSIVSDMRRLGLQPLTPQSGTPTATGQSIEAAKAHSAVQAWALGLKDAIEQALVFTAEWLGEDEGAEVDVSTDFSVVPFAQAPLTALKDARAASAISLRTYWQGLRRFDVLPQDFDPDEEELALAEEQQGLEPEEPIDPVTGAPIERGETADA